MSLLINFFVLILVQILSGFAAAGSVSPEACLQKQPQFTLFCLSRCYRFFILFLMLILCLVLLSLSLHACSHNADRRGNTKGRGN